MSDSRAWIVRGDEILVVDDSGVVGGEPSIAGRRKLGVEETRRIQCAMAELPSSARGKVYDGGSLDGITLDISFDPDGKGTAESVQISNTWVEQFHPLLAAISELAPPDCPISFIEYATRPGYMDDRPTTVYTRDDWTRLRNRYDSPMPWWCVWRKLVD